jgi:hypothetical protein
MTLRTGSVLVMAVVLVAFSVVSTVATLAGLTIPSALAVGTAAVLALEVAIIVTSLVPATSRRSS